eukprot:TRINITY_DN1928_c0_g1_i1.p1 TRINITY_DN1928_c0_g1~~TRINITY_DN1928_c0_g1_i1.p1  ORF type:complete len:276 (+),score=43.52 TRINITY_DN1928_c0_g1_i1:188-1015(+)
MEVEMEASNGTGFSVPDAFEGHKPNKSKDTTVVVQKADKVEVISEIANRAVEVDNAALDSILSLNSFFCVAIFIGISLPAQQGAAQASADSASGDNQAPPIPCELHNPESTRQTVLMLEIVAFACIMLSTLFAVGLKMVLNINSNKSGGSDARIFHKPGGRESKSALPFFRFVMFVSATSLIAALVLLCISMVFYVELYAGRLTCSARTQKSTVPLIILTAVGLLFLLFVLLLFVKYSAVTFNQISHLLKKGLGLREKGVNDPKDVESLLSPSVG